MLFIVCSPLTAAKLGIRPPDANVTAASPPQWQQDLSTVKQQHGQHQQHLAFDSAAGHTSQSFPHSLLHATSSSDAAVSGSLPGASDSKSDNHINESDLHAQTGPPELSMLQPALSGATDSAGYVTCMHVFQWGLPREYAYAL